jgi:hypothetical protein
MATIWHYNNYLIDWNINKILEQKNYKNAYEELKKNVVSFPYELISNMATI